MLRFGSRSRSRPVLVFARHFLCQLESEPPNPFEHDGVWYEVMSREAIIRSANRGGPAIVIVVRELEEDDD
jgi:hypothetical protein